MITGIILAGGDGNRFGGKKQFLKIEGKMLWEIVKEKAEKALDEIIVVGVDIPGGATRQLSVYEGLKIANGDKVIIFDAVRPLVSIEQIERVKKYLDGNISVSLYREPVDTIYYRREYIRKGAYCLQVPQGFSKKYLLEAHEEAFKNKDIDNTDDTILLRKYIVGGQTPLLIEGGQNLYKITYPDDIDIIRMMKKKLN